MKLTRPEMSVCLDEIFGLALKFLKSEPNQSMPVFSLVFLKPSPTRIVGVSMPPLSRPEFTEWIHKLAARQKIGGFCFVSSGSAFPNEGEMSRVRAELWMKEHGTLADHPQAIENLIGYASAPDIEILRSVLVFRDDRGCVVDSKETNASFGNQEDIKALRVDW